MSAVLLFVAGLAAVTYLLRLAGVSTAARAGMDGRWSLFTALLPVALLAAVVTVQAAPAGRPAVHLAVAAVVAGVAARRLGFLPAMLLGTAAGALVSLGGF
ncbi:MULTISPECIES: AzlD domain-containing protein [Streptosporangium]|uniref:Membrane protein n=1 Tax=Streptosporangium brasiliense TaxID=47480 RepID=A0ABT9REB0_9ACTN|nr:AzlD domain-containing protein [Streptosporangium brasiliense]MDP9867473.1 putative membrane protein [Streptosporangium brasiliense]